METEVSLPMMSNVPDIRVRILARLGKMKWSHYRLAKEVEGRGIRKQTVYDFLAGRSTINSDYLGHIMDALGLDVAPARKPR